jgi:hypothetical protein
MNLYNISLIVHFKYFYRGSQPNFENSNSGVKFVFVIFARNFGFKIVIENREFIKNKFIYLFEIFVLLSQFILIITNKDSWEVSNTSVNYKIDNMVRMNMVCLFKLYQTIF